MAFLADMQGDMVDFHQAMAQEDIDYFVEEVVKEVNGPIYNAHFKLVHIKLVPEDTDILPCVCSM